MIKYLLSSIRGETLFYTYLHHFNESINFECRIRFCTKWKIPLTNKQSSHLFQIHYFDPKYFLDNTAKAKSVSSCLLLISQNIQTETAWGQGGKLLMTMCVFIVQSSTSSSVNVSLPAYPTPSFPTEHTYNGTAWLGLTGQGIDKHLNRWGAQM